MLLLTVPLLFVVMVSIKGARFHCRLFESRLGRSGPRSGRNVPTGYPSGSRRMWR